MFGPAPMLTFAFLQVGSVADGARGFWLALLASIFVAIGPYSALLLLARRGRVSDRFVGQRAQRAPILMAVLLSLVVGLVLLVLLRAPGALIAVTIAAAIGLLVVTAVNLRWKLSIHCAIVAFVWALQWQYLPSYVAAVLVLVPAIVAWARVMERAHSIAQAVAGLSAGVAVFACYIGLLAALT